MSKSLIAGLILLGLSVLVFIFTRGNAEVDLVILDPIKMRTSVALFSSMGLGVTIGLLLHK